MTTKAQNRLPFSQQEPRRHLVWGCLLLPFLSVSFWTDSIELRGAEAPQRQLSFSAITQLPGLSRDPRARAEVPGNGVPKSGPSCSPGEPARGQGAATATPGHQVSSIAHLGRDWGGGGKEPSRAEDALLRLGSSSPQCSSVSPLQPWENGDVRFRCLN